MKVLAINSSPRKSSVSKTALLLHHLTQGMRHAGAEVEAVDIHEKTIEYCTACFACFNRKFNETEVCIHKDDMTAELLPKWQAADLVVYASPVFFHSITAKLKTFFERTLPVYVSFGGEAEGSYNPAGNPAHPALAFLAVSGSPEDSAFDDYSKYVRCFEPIAEIYRNGSTLMSLPFCADRVADILAATREAGAELVRERRVSEATMARIRQPLHDDTAFVQRIADAHQTLLPGHRALMTFPTQVRRELRNLPTPQTGPDANQALSGAAAGSPPDVIVDAPPAARRRVQVETAGAHEHERTLARLRQTLSAPAAPPAPDIRPATPPTPKPAPGHDDIAVIGMSGRFASAEDLGALWRVLEQGENLVTEAARWDLRARYGSADGYGRHGGFLPALDAFDALFFKIAGNEARYMDPQQRIFLEEAWHALEDAGYGGGSVSGTRCGVYVGCGDGDYRQLFAGKTPPQAFWGNAASVIPARIAYFLNLKGPAVSVDTACSSSLVAIHMACQALRAGEVEMAISGGVFMQCTPRLFDAANGAGMLSPTGRCATFDAGADGFVIGEGCGAVILKRLADALAAGDHVHGVIKASGTNQDGATNGLTAPSAVSQERLITEVYDRFGIDPDSIGFIECHGTGTKLGDPIEFNALARAFHDRADSAGLCAIGSIKTNIGHAGAAAGVAGLLKALLALQHRKIPASLHFEHANPLVRLDGSRFFVPVGLTEWAGQAAPRRAAVSSFGFSGTNAHVVVEEAPPRRPRASDARPHLIALSARTPEQLRREISALRDRVAAEPAMDPGDVAYVLLTGRRHGKVRFTCVVRDRQDLLDQLDAGAATAGRAVTQDPDAPGDLRQEAAGNALIAAAREAEGDARLSHLRTVAGHFLAGDVLRYEDLFVRGAHYRIPLPPTPFERRSYWADAGAAADLPPLPVPADVPPSAPAATLAAGDVVLVPVLEAVELAAPPAPPADEETGPLIIAVSGADGALVQALRRDAAASRVMPLDPEQDDDGLRAALLAALGNTGRLIWIAPRPDETQAAGAVVPEAQAAGVLLLFRAVRELLAAGLGARPLDLTVVVQQTASVHGETTCADHAAIVGFAGSLANEAARWTIRVADVELDVSDCTGLAADFAGLPVSPAGVVFYGRTAGGRHRQWYRHSLVPAAAAEAPDAAPYRQGGVFVVFGGAGGIGRTWSEHVIRATGARIVWIGRRPLDAGIAAEMDRLAAFGPRPHYIAADCTRADAVARAHEEIRTRFGAVHGLVFSAIVLRDAAVTNLTLAAFNDALRPKVDLSVHAVRAFHNEPLDFVLFFSSLIAFTTSAGQSNYAAGCTFTDALAERLGQELACPVKVMNWGYWGDVGIVSGAEYRERMAKVGVASIEPPAAMQALATLLTHGPNRLAFMKTARAVAIPHVDAGSRIDLCPPRHVAAAAPATKLLAMGEDVRALRPQLRILESIEAAIAPIAAAHVAAAGVPGPGYLKDWLDETRCLLAARGPSRAEPHDAREAWDRQREAWRGDPDYQARCELVDATLRALPDVLAGRTAATDVLFPAGSLRLVEPIYRRNSVADAFNRWVADAVVEEIERCAAAGRTSLRILEIGAGTGGTTAGLLERLRTSGCDGLVGEYAYTDVSSAFLRQGREQFAAAAPFLTCRLLDITAPLAGQGFSERGYDAVIAANVLHATPRIREALRHAKQALRPGGLLLLNELSRHTLLTHLTFGLLEAWWAARDRALRMPGGPALSPEAWSAVLRDEGFTAVAFPAREAHGLGQQIVIARSDGTLRRAADAPALPEPARAMPSPVAAAKPLAQAAPPREPTEDGVARITAEVLRALSECLGVDAGAIDAGEAFADYGLDSLNAVQLAQELNRSLGCTLKPADLYSHTSAARLAQHVARSGVVPPAPQASEPAPAACNPASAASDPAPAANRRATPEPAAGGAEAIAVIGMSGRFGSAATLDDLWRVLLGGSCLTGWSERWKTQRHRGAFCPDIAAFDPGFFNISGLEAAYMDPQQRVFLEEAWKALEDAGYAGDGPEGVRGREVGVFVGCYPGDYFQLIDERAPAQAMWGAAGAVIPARLSYFLDLHGPAVAVDTACSSSLVAIHQACRSLLAGECEMAVAGGVALQSTPRFFDFATRANMLSASGRCRAFEARADGFVLGEGAGVLVLKKLARALADGDHVHGVIRRTGLNQDGASNGITAPNGEAQLRLLGATYEAAGIDPATIGLLEAHGTGTKLGDPIEFEALRTHFAGARVGSCALGSVKANIGHTLAAAGVAGLITVLLALRHRTLPPAPDFEAPNPALALQDSPFFINRAPRVWPAEPAAPRRAAVSSFGFSGTNAHAIIEEAPVAGAPCSTADAGTPHLFVLSAASAGQLRDAAMRLAACLRATGPDPASVSFTLLAGRRAMTHRLAWAAAGSAGVLERLDNFLAGTADADVFSGAVDPSQPRDAARWRDGRAAIERLADGRHPPSAETLRELARRFVEGHSIPAARLFPDGGRRVPLPAYPFASERHWVPEPREPAASAAPALAAVRPAGTCGDTPADIEAPRSSKLWHLAWRETPLSLAGAGLPAQAVILASPSTQLLAQRIARHLPGSVIVGTPESVAPGHAADTVIDCAGCAPVDRDNLDWLARAQALAQPGRAGPGRYLCLTRGLAATDAEDTVAAPDGRVTRAALARMLQSEYRRLRSAHVDFATTASDDVIVDGVLAELAAEDTAPHIAWRGGRRLTAVLAGLDAAAAAGEAFPAEQVLWITGGTRGLGLLCASHFASRHGVRRMVLTGRRPVSPPAEWAELAGSGDPAAAQYRRYLELQASGVAVNVIPLDLCDAEAVRQAVADTMEQLGPIGALLHCAGMADADTPAFIRKTAESMRRVWQPKVAGLETIWHALREQPLQFAVLFSSVTAAVPALAVGQSDYAMANAYLDAFARHCPRRTAAGKPVVISVQWPNWKESGMGEVTSEALRDSGFMPMTDAEGLALLDRVLATRAAPVVLPAVMSGELLKAAPAAVPETAPPAGVEDWLADVFAGELQIPRSRLQPGVPFHDYGVDSILLAQLCKTIGEQLGRVLDPSLLYTCPTLSSLSGWLRDNHADALAARLLPASPVPAAVASPADIPAIATPAAGRPAGGGASAEPIAIVGMACRFGGAPDLDAYWELLRSGQSAIAPVPAERWARPAGVHAALLGDLDLFDPAFFAIPEADARAMPAQARIMLELSAATFSHAGYRNDEVKGQPIGVYIGGRGAAPARDSLLEEARYPVRAVGANYLAAGISHFFDLHGPSMVIDTACSSALVAMQAAIQAMRCGEQEAALVGGICVLDSDGPLRLFRRRGLYSDSGRFHVFDRRANGVVLGEGGGMVLLKPLERARRDGDTIYAVVDGLAINSDGRTAGPSAPNIEAQIAVMRSALRAAGRDPADVAHVEVNGSGSEVSDLLELKAMAAIYGAVAGQPGPEPLSLGSVKPNIGHPLCAEGIASFIKLACMLHHGVMVPFLSAEQPLRHFDFAASRFRFGRVTADWPEARRIGAVSCFADGGTNAHAILSAVAAPRGRRKPLPPPLMHRYDLARRAPSPDAGSTHADRPAINFWMAQ
jgi:acyl transferase domain-containing protein/acyl carrier protein/SAM-dependent methyltransferase/FMN-dependent NADH-azoreductase